VKMKFLRVFTYLDVAFAQVHADAIKNSATIKLLIVLTSFVQTLYDDGI
jgi:hypothetical protein